MRPPKNGLQTQVESLRLMKCMGWLQTCLQAGNPAMESTPLAALKIFSFTLEEMRFYYH